MLTQGKLACLTIIAIIIFSSLMITNEATATNVASLITTDTTWTLAGSPYTLTGPTAVNKGVTLTIEAGVTINVNNYYIQVNGTLIAVGTDSQPVTFNGGRLFFTEVSNGWNQQTNTGNKIEYAIINQTNIISTSPIKLNHNTITGPISAGNNTIIANNKISASLTVEQSSIITDNTLSGVIYTGSKTTISNNIISAPITTGASCIINGNSITGSPEVPRYGYSPSAILTVGTSSVITNNAITGILDGSPSEVRGNTIEGGGSYQGIFSRETYSVPAVRVSSTLCKFTANTIKGTVGEAIEALDATFVDNNIIGHISASDKSTFQHNTISGTASGNSFSNNRIYGSITLKGSSPKATSNLIENGGIYCQSNQTLIKDNIISKGSISNAAGTIQNNQITEGSGITTSAGPITIEGNTISKNTIGISIGSGHATITNNNLEDNNQSISLTGSGDISAINNWWGTTDEQAISDSIHDFKNDFNLGKVTYTPFLAAPNQQAGPAQNMNLPNTTPITPTPNPTTAPPDNRLFVVKLLTWPLFVLAVLAATAIILVFIYVWWNKKTPNRAT